MVMTVTPVEPLTVKHPTVDPEEWQVDE